VHKPKDLKKVTGLDCELEGQGVAELAGGGLDERHAEAGVELVIGDVSAVLRGGHDVGAVSAGGRDVGRFAWAADV
jgi:hypothetical protein